MKATYTKFKNKPSDMDEEQFVDCFGAVYEHSSWIARLTWQKGLSVKVDTVDGLSAALMETVAQAEREPLLKLVKAHPDLAGRAAMQNKLTEESTAEQSSAGINACTNEEFERFNYLNNAYKMKFAFPFVMAVKDSNRHKILTAFEKKINNDVDTEFQRSIDEINKIARFRLEAIASET